MENKKIMSKSWSPLAQEILACKQRWRGHRRVPKKNQILEHPWNLVQWQNATRSFI